MNSKSLLRPLLAVITLVGLTVVCFKYLDIDAMRQAWQSFSWSACGLLLMLPVLYLLFKSYRFYLLLRPLTSAPAKDIMMGYAASQAASLLPGGVAMRAAMMARLGVPVERSSGPVLANSACDQLFLLLVGLGLCYRYPELRMTALGLTGVLLFMVAVVWHPKSRAWIASSLGGVAQRLDKQKWLERFFECLSILCNLNLFWKAMFWTTLANLVSLTTLGTVVYSFGLPVEPAVLTAAYVIPNLLGRLSPLPAGAGVIEAGMVGFIATQSAMGQNEAAVVTIIFRIVDVVLPAIYGALCHLLPAPSSDASLEKVSATPARVVP